MSALHKNWAEYVAGIIIQISINARDRSLQKQIGSFNQIGYPGYRQAEETCSGYVLYIL